MTRQHAPESSPKKAVVAGGLGVSGRAIVNHLVALGDWEVIGLSRRAPDFPTSARYLAVDLLDGADLERQLGEFHDVTDVFYTALQMRPNPFDEVRLNLAMLQHTVEAIERSSNRLKKVVLMEGAPTWGPTRRRPGKMTRATCRRTFITTRRIISRPALLPRAGLGRHSDLRASAALLLATR
jgi:nucleoside-diphosphate-sugar epimerase